MGATMMLFTTLYFWRLFALVLFFTIVQATVGSFVVFMVFADSIGPSNPTYLVNWILSQLAGIFIPEIEEPKAKSIQENTDAKEPQAEPETRETQEGWSDWPEYTTEIEC